MSSDDIVFEAKGPLGLITLNRPEQLNALTHDMARRLDAQLRLWDADPAVTVIAITGAGETAFCAGGDIRALYEAGRVDPAQTYPFYRDEYRLNALIKRLKTPYIAFMDGVTMGGGVGVSIHGRYRVAGDHTLIAMPETSIGFIPDIGASFVLSRLPRRLGVFAGLTGARFRAQDGIFAHLVDYYVRSERTPVVLEALASAEYADDADEVICEILAVNAAAPETSQYRAHVEEIETAFSAETLEAALSALEGGSAWAVEQAARIKRNAPFASKAAWRALQEGGRLSLEDCLAMEHRVVRASMRRADFYEGVRAAIIDKDRAPSWSPSTLEAVDPSELDAAFARIGADELRFD